MVGNQIKFNNIWLKNQCRENLNFKLKFTNTDGILTEVNQYLTLNEEAFMFKTATSSYYIKIENTEWVKIKITTSNWGKIIHNLPCVSLYDE